MASELPPRPSPHARDYDYVRDTTPASGIDDICTINGGPVLAAGLVVYGAVVVGLLIAAAQQGGDPRTFKDAAAMALCCFLWLPLMFAWGAIDHYSKATKRTEEL